MLENKHVWSWEAIKQQVNENTKVGDVVDVGYMRDCDEYNYQQAVITMIDKTDKNFYQIRVRFDDGHERMW